MLLRRCVCPFFNKYGYWQRFSKWVREKEREELNAIASRCQPALLRLTMPASLCMITITAKSNCAVQTVRGRLDWTGEYC
jgi:hypothetical protein